MPVTAAHLKAEESPPSRRRGLKSCLCGTLRFRQSRLLRGGVDWNGKKVYALGADNKSPPSRRRGLKFCISSLDLPTLCRLLRGGVDWNCQKHGCSMAAASRLLRGGVDWNCSSDSNYANTVKVASFAEAWIEIMISFLVIFPGSRRLLRGGVDWNR